MSDEIDPPRQIAAEHDEPRPAMTQHDAVYSLTPHHVVELLAASGFPRDHRTVQRWCVNGTLDVVKDDLAGYFITPESVDRKIVHLRQLHELEQRRHATPGHDAARHAVPGHGVSASIPPAHTMRQAATESVVSVSVASHPPASTDAGMTGADTPHQDTPRRVAAGDDAASRETASPAVSALVEQLRVKDEQLKVKDEQIRDLTQAMTKSQDTLQQQNALMLGFQGIMKSLSPLLPGARAATPDDSRPHA